MEYARWIVFLLLNPLIFFAWFGLQNRPQHTVATRLLMASVLSAAQVIGTIFLLGLPWAQLTAANLVFLNAGLAGVLLTFAVVRFDIRGSLRELGRAIQKVYEIVGAEPVVKILAVLTVLTIVWIAFLGVIYPPFEWDSLMYHLPAVGHYIQQESLSEPPVPMDDDDIYGVDASVWVNAFPKNIELLFLWATIIPGNDTLVDLVELVFGLIGIVAVYALATRLGVNRTWAVSAGFLFFLTPIVIAQSRSNYIDLSISALILVVMALLYPGSSRRRLDEVIIAGIAMGIVVGAKWSGLMLLPVLWMMLVGQRLYWNHRHRLPKLNKIISESGFFLGPALLFGSYWYVKNWLMYGNPLWPIRISFFGNEVFNGVFSQEEVLASDNRERHQESLLSTKRQSRQ